MLVYCKTLTHNLLFRVNVFQWDSVFIDLKSDRNNFKTAGQTQLKNVVTIIDIILNIIISVFHCIVLTLSCGYFLFKWSKYLLTNQYNKTSLKHSITNQWKATLPYILGTKSNCNLFQYRISRNILIIVINVLRKQRLENELVIQLHHIKYDVFKFFLTRF